MGVRLSPLGTFNDMHDDDPEATFSYVVEKLNRYGLAYLHIVNPALAATGADVAFIERAERMSQMIRRTYRGVLMVAGGFDEQCGKMARGRQRGPDRIRTFVHRQSRPAGTLAIARSAQFAGSFHVLRRR